MLSIPLAETVASTALTNTDELPGFRCDAFGIGPSLGKTVMYVDAVAASAVRLMLRAVMPVGISQLPTTPVTLTALVWAGPNRWVNAPRCSRVSKSLQGTIGTNTDAFAGDVPPASAKVALPPPNATVIAAPIAAQRERIMVISSLRFKVEHPAGVRNNCRSTTNNLECDLCE
jgi:hypothetical protein